jgi:hypothetical protein
MAARWHAITDPVRDALESVTEYQGPRATITKQLEPAEWRAVKTVLEKRGAVYVAGTSAFEFEPDEDAESIVRAAVAAGRVMHQANAAGFVATPADLAAELVELYADAHVLVGRGGRILEPSAGTGRFVQAVTDYLGSTWAQITAVEPEARRARQIPAGEHVTVVVETFETYADRAQTTGEQFDLVVMNPPFSVPRRPTIWVDHLLAAWALSRRTSPRDPASIGPRRGADGQSAPGSRLGPTARRRATARRRRVR